MSSTIFSTTPGTPLGIDPHADVEDAGRQTPVAPNAARDEAPAPGNPPGADLVQAEPRLRRMLDTALDRSGGLRGIGGDLYEALKAEIPRPKLFHGGFSIHSAMLDAAKACDAAAAKLRGIPIGDFRGNPLPDAAFKALKGFVDAQNKLYSQIAAFQKASGVRAALLDSLAQATQFRASEALNFAATMQLMAMPANRQQEVAPGVAEPLAPTAGKAMQDMAHFMHGSGGVTGAFRADAARLFGKIDELEARKGQMPLDVFQDTIARLRDDLETLRRCIDAAINPDAAPDEGIAPEGDPAHLPDGGVAPEGGPLPDGDPAPAPDSGPVLIPDRSLFAPAEAMLARSAERLDALAAADPKAGVRSAIRAILPLVDPSLFHEASILPNGLGTQLSVGLARYNARVGELMARFDAGELSPEQLEHEMREAMDILQIPDTRRACGTLLTMMEIAKEPRMTTEEIESYYLKFCGERILPGMADKLRRSVEQSGLVFMPPEVERLAAQIGSTPLITRNEIFTAEIMEAVGMLRSTGANPQARGEYIQAALDHHVDMNTVLEASLRGIMTDQLELRAGDAILKGSRKLGQGAANTVHLCTYRGRDGEDMRLVFKPEVGARRGLDGLAAGGLGYRDGARTMQLNVAASRAADAIGCGGAIARSSIGSHDGQLGLFMEAAPGKTFYDVLRGKPCCRMPDGRELNFREACHVLRSNGKLDAMRANLMRELSRLEWADVLSGQVDRHGNNYLVDINPQTGAVKITGIDNDASFGTLKRGMTVVDLSNPTQYQKKFLKLLEGQRYAVPADGRIDLSTIPPGLLYTACQVFGFNQLFKPALIDRDTFDKLMALDETDYRAMLAPCMDDEAVDAAVDRLREAKAYATELAKGGRVVDDWAAPSVMETYARHKLSAKARFEEKVQSGFFTRDFLAKFSDIL